MLLIFVTSCQVLPPYGLKVAKPATDVGGLQQVTTDRNASRRLAACNRYRRIGMHYIIRPLETDDDG